MNTSNSKELNADYSFSTIQSMNNNLENFKQDEFEYMVIDACVIIGLNLGKLEVIRGFSA